jgi:hypothetical protein
MSKEYDFDLRVEEKLLAAGISVSKCTACEESIIFLKTKQDKWMPLDMNLEPHWAKCPQRDKFRRKG